MSTDVLPETQSRSQAPRGRRRSGRQGSSRGRWWRPGLILIGVVAAVASVAALIAGAISSPQIGPKLTYTITRGDLIVTVTEQGTLESSENTEIKCKVRTARVPIIWVIEAGTEVKPGDELARLETREFDDRLNEASKYVHMTRSAAERSEADVTRAKLAIPEYLDGRYKSELTELQKDLAIAQSDLRTAENLLAHAKMMAQRGYVSDLVVEERTFGLTQAKLTVEVTSTQIEVLESFTKAMEMKTLNGNLNASKARHEANKARVKQTADQLVLCSADVENCVVKAETSGLVIYPTAEPWKRIPEIEEGASVYMGQTMLLMPDLSKMQVKVGIRESVVDRVKPGLAARITLPDRTLHGEVSSVSSVTGPAGWWSGNVAKYDTIIKLPSLPGLKPGMSAEVEVIMDRHEDVLTIPVAAVVETAQGDFCWVKTAAGAKRRSLKLGDTNDVFTVVKAGLEEGDEVMLNPIAFIEEAQSDALKPLDEAKSSKPSSREIGNVSKPPEPTAAKPPDASKQQESKPQAAKPEQAASQPKTTGAQIIKLADKNYDGVLTIDEYAEKDRHTFGTTDTNKDGRVDASELDAAMKRLEEAKPK